MLPNYNVSRIFDKPVSIYTDSGKVVGEVVNDTFKKTIRGSRHLLRKPPAIAFDVSTLTRAEAAGAVKVEVFDKETRTLYRAAIEHIRAYGLVFNRGFGEQIALTLSGWTKTTIGSPVQLSLLGQ